MHWENGKYWWNILSDNLIYERWYIGGFLVQPGMAENQPSGQHKLFSSGPQPPWYIDNHIKLNQKHSRTRALICSDMLHDLHLITEIQMILIGPELCMNAKNSRQSYLQICDVVKLGTMMNVLFFSMLSWIVLLSNPAKFIILSIRKLLSHVPPFLPVGEHSWWKGWLNEQRWQYDDKRNSTSEAKSRKVLRTVHSLTKTHIREFLLQHIIHKE